MATAYVRFTDDALDDLTVLGRKDPQIVRPVLKKCLLLQRDPHAGEPLLGELVGYRKLVVGDRGWRIVWRVTDDSAGEVTIDIAEIWAIGARADAEVYTQMSERVGQMNDGPPKQALEEVIAILAPTAGIEARVEPRVDPVPPWLRDRLIHTAGMEAEAVDALAGADAADLWDRYMRGGPSPSSG